MSQKKMPLDISNTKNAFHLKKNSDLLISFFLFKLISSNILVKVGIILTRFFLRIRFPIKTLIKITVFDHFCGGVSPHDCMPKIKNMFKSNVFSVLDYCVERKEKESEFDHVMERTLNLIDFAFKTEALPFVVFKPSGLGRFDIYEKVSKSSDLNESESLEWNSVKSRFDRICDYANKKNIILLVDAEESWIQDSVDDLVIDLMKKYNKNNVTIFNTIQAYRWDRLKYLYRIHSLAKSQNFKLGIKLVRGAYMEKECLRAIKNGYKSPICHSKVETDKNFDKCLSYILNNLSQINLFLGTHNESSTMKAVKIIDKKKIERNSKSIWFSQLYGMSDHISFNLSKAGFNVAKYLPFGPIKDVIPYLFRRAQENSSVKGQTTRELALIRKERLRRKINSLC